MEYCFRTNCLIFWISLQSVLTSTDNLSTNTIRTRFCSTYTDCYTCTSRDCKWCPLDEICSETASPYSSSQCNPVQNINSTINCGNKLFKGYNAAVAYENVLLTAVADTNKSAECLKKLFPKRDYYIVANISVPCDDFIFSYPNCYAYVGITHSNKTIIVAYRGTKNVKQLVEEALASLVFPKMPFEAGGNVQEYFYNAHCKLYEPVKKSVVSLKAKHPGYKVLVLGHSLGGAIASLASASLVFENITQSNHLTLYTFGMPRVGNRRYAEIHDKLVPSSYRLVHHNDIVPHLPIMFGSVRPKNKTGGSYHHGREVFYPNKNMNLNSNFTVCRADEDNKCSDGAMTKLPCVFNMSSCIEDHLFYFGVKVSNYCDNILHLK